MIRFIAVAVLLWCGSAVAQQVTGPVNIGGGGRGGALPPSSFPILAPSGTPCTAPTYSFSADPTAGMSYGFTLTYPTFHAAQICGGVDGTLSLRGPYVVVEGTNAVLDVQGITSLAGALVLQAGSSMESTIDTTWQLDGGVNGLNIDSNTLSIDAANNRVGIGTAAPNSALEVSGTGDVHGEVFSTSANSYGNVDARNDTGGLRGIQLHVAGNATGGTFLNSADDGNAMLAAYGAGLTAVKFGTDVDAIPFSMGNRCNACGELTGHPRWTLNANGTVTFNPEGKSYVDTQIQGDTDANTFFVDASADEVGIGTATPGAKLDVNGTSRAIGFTTNGGDVNVTSAGHFVTSGTVPTIGGGSTCTATSIAGASADSVGQLTGTCTVGQTIILTMNTSYGSNTPICVITPANGNAVTAAFEATSPTATTVTFVAGVGIAASSTFNYFCPGLQ